MAIVHVYGVTFLWVDFGTHKLHNKSKINWDLNGTARTPYRTLCNMAFSNPTSDSWDGKLQRSQTYEPSPRRESELILAVELTDELWAPLSPLIRRYTRVSNLDNLRSVFDSVDTTENKPLKLTFASRWENRCQKDESLIAIKLF